MAAYTDVYFQYIPKNSDLTTAEKLEGWMISHLADKSTVKKKARHIVRRSRAPAKSTSASRVVLPRDFFMRTWVSHIDHLREILDLLHAGLHLLYFIQIVLGISSDEHVWLHPTRSYSIKHSVRTGMGNGRGGASGGAGGR